MLALIALRDEPRPEAAEAIARLRGLGVRHVSMLTGDNERTAQRDRAGGSASTRCSPSSSPRTRSPPSRGCASAMARSRWSATASTTHPPWRTADLGIAMGTGGTDAAIEAADVALMADDITKVAEALRLGRRATRISRQNLLFSVLMLAVLIPSAVVGLLTVVVAVAVHEAAELLAVANGVRAAQAPRPAPAAA